MMARRGASRLRFLECSVTLGATGLLGTTWAGRTAVAVGHLPDPASVLADISVDKYVREDYRTLYNMSGEPLWDPAKD